MVVNYSDGRADGLVQLGAGLAGQTSELSDVLRAESYLAQRRQHRCARPLHRSRAVQANVFRLDSSEASSQGVTSGSRVRPFAPTESRP